MTSPHRYGPHVAQHAPNAVTILTPGPPSGGHGRPESVVRALPAELVKQRRDLNELARAMAAGEGTMHDCSAKGRPVWVPARYCPLCRKVVATDG